MEIRFKLNPENEKDKKIIEFLNREYSASVAIKSILYKMATEGRNGTNRDGYGLNLDSTETFHKTQAPIWGADRNKVDDCGTVCSEFDDYFT